jgi:hypothetical protein
MQTLMEKTMEQVRKDPLIAFTKHLFVCDLAFGLEFLNQIQIHYDMNYDRKMFTKKLQILALAVVSNKHKVS